MEHSAQARAHAAEGTGGDATSHFAVSMCEVTKHKDRYDLVSFMSQMSPTKNFLSDEQLLLVTVALPTRTSFSQAGSTALDSIG